jgi:hypothetical protein
MKIKHLYWVAAAILVVCALASSSRAQTTNLIVDDTFNSGVDYYPGTSTGSVSPYSDDGVVNSYGDIESAFIRAGSGTITVTAPGGGAAVVGSPNVLFGNGEGANSATWYTFFTSSTSSAVKLVNPGDEMILTWQFTPTGVAVINNNQGFTVTVAQTPSGQRTTGWATQNQAAYTGFSTYMNMGTTLSNTAPFQLKRWALGSTPSALVGSSGNWTNLVQTGTKGNTGYTSGTQYTYTMALTLDSSGNLDVVNSMVGDSLNNVGSMSVSYVDTAPTTDGAGLSFDTFDIRPTSTNISAVSFTTSLFEVQQITVPEPSTLLLVGAGLGMLVGLVRRQRRH